MKLIPTKHYKEIIKVLPILCVDIIIQNKKGEYLLVRRTNEPLKGEWWVVGGRVQKGECLTETVIRKVKEEIGLDIADSRPVGYFEEVFNVELFGDPVEYHGFSVVFLVKIEDDQKINLDTQSSEWKYDSELPNNFIVKNFLT